MHKIIVLFVVALAFISCSLNEPKVIKGNEKAFADEDTYIMFALRSEQIKDYKSASQLFDILYAKSEKKEYLYRSLENDLHAKADEKIIQRVDKLLVKDGFDARLLRFKIVALVDLGKLVEASELASKLVETTKATDDYILASDIYIKRQKFDLALKYLESAYAKNKNEKILDKLSILLYVNLDRKKDAIAQLETHSRILGCSKLACTRLAAFYSNDNNIDGLLSTYLRMYEIDKDKNIATKIIQIYAYKKDYANLTLFLEKSKINDALLLQLYASSKNYAKAYPLAQALYDETSEIDYLGQSAIFEYESAPDKNLKPMLTSVVDKLQKVVQEDNQPLYLNYLGYILIDHRLDIKKGMRYIKEVLKKQPNSAFYLDSLAWGHYRLGECKKAKDIMNRVVTLKGGDNSEVLKHIKEIDECLNKKR